MSFQCESFRINPSRKMGLDNVPSLLELFLYLRHLAHIQVRKSVIEIATDFSVPKTLRKKAVDPINQLIDQIDQYNYRTCTPNLSNMVQYDNVDIDQDAIDTTTNFWGKLSLLNLPNPINLSDLTRHTELDKAKALLTTASGYVDYKIIPVDNTINVLEHLPQAYFDCELDCIESSVTSTGNRIFDIFDTAAEATQTLAKVLNGPCTVLVRQLHVVLLGRVETPVCTIISRPMTVVSGDTQTTKSGYTVLLNLIPSDQQPTTQWLHSY